MYKCEHCEREDFKSESGLKRHIKNCKAKVEAEIETELEVVVDEVDNSDKIKRRVSKLRDAAKSCGDALTRHKLEMEAKRLEDG